MLSYYGLNDGIIDHFKWTLNYKGEKVKNWWGQVPPYVPVPLLCSVLSTWWCRVRNMHLAQRAQI